MRTPICDINLYPPTPSHVAMAMENTDLKANNTVLTNIVIGAAVVGAVCLAIYLWEKHEEQKMVKVRRNV